MKFNFPKTIFVERNTLGEQIEHVLSEADEVTEAFSAPDGLDWYSRINEELADLTQSLETFWRIMADYHSEDYVEAVFPKVRAKNQARGYYTTPTPPAATQEQSR